MPAPEGFAVNPELSLEEQRIFDNTPEDESRSRLEPYRELILLWRRRGRSYRRICRSLQEQSGCSVAHSTLRRFVQRHSRPRKGQPEVQAEEAIATPARTANGPSSDHRARMRKAKEQPVTGHALELKLFEFTEEDARKPLELMSAKPKEK
jgi:hypothetical protein